MRNRKKRILFKREAARRAKETATPAANKPVAVEPEVPSQEPILAIEEPVEAPVAEPVVAKEIEKPKPKRRRRRTTKKTAE